jgi:ABC-type nitrate/sulfonate/bicarbonate transport system permease component
VSGRAPGTRVRRALVAVALLAVLYGVLAEVGSRVLPRVALIGSHEYDVELFPPYGSLAEEAVFLVRSGILPHGAVASGLRVLGGLALGTLVGVPLGLLMVSAARLGAAVEPWVVFFRFTPALALLPLYVLWFGAGEAARILLIATGVGVVMLQGAVEGVRAVPRVYLDAARALGASRRMVFRRVVWPAALPHIVASLRIATGLAWVTIVVAELVRPTMPSLGYLLALSGAYARVPAIVVTLATIGALVLISDTIAVALYHRATGWMRRRVA